MRYNEGYDGTLLVPVGCKPELPTVDEVRKIKKNLLKAEVDRARCQIHEELRAGSTLIRVELTEGMFLEESRPGRLTLTELAIPPLADLMQELRDKGYSVECRHGIPVGSSRILQVKYDPQIEQF